MKILNFKKNSKCIDNEHCFRKKIKKFAKPKSQSFAILKN